MRDLCTEQGGKGGIEMFVGSSFSSSGEGFLDERGWECYSLLDLLPTQDAAFQGFLLWQAIDPNNWKCGICFCSQRSGYSRRLAAGGGDRDADAYL